MIASRTYPYDLVSRVLSGRLHGRTASAELQALVHRQSIDWNRVIGYASMEYALPAFAAALRDLDLNQFVDEELALFLAAVHAANLERNGELGGELSRAVGVLNRIGIEPVLLKGAIRLVDGLYPDMGWRMLRDLDLLVQKEALGEAIRAFEEAGYAPCGSGAEMQRPLGACQIDLHSEAFFTPRRVRLLQAADILDQAEAINLRDGRAWIPSVEHQIVHLIGHCQLRHLGHAFGRISLCNRLEAAALVTWGRSRIRWEAIFERFVATGYRRPLLSFLLGLSDGGWCAVPLADDVDLLTTLQQRRIALQARSSAFGYTSSRVGWWISAFNSQIEKSDGGERKGINNLKRLMSERGALGRVARSFMSRRRHLTHALPYVSWLSFQ